MPTEKSFQYHTDARRNRNDFYRTAKPLTEQLAKVLNDADLNPEAKIRRAAPIRKQIADAAETHRMAARMIVERAERREQAVAPERLRRAAALAAPGKTAEFAALFATLPLSELSAMAEELEAAERPAREAIFALVNRARTFATGEDAPTAAALIARADAWLNEDRAEVRADRVVAQQEALMLNIDAEAALGLPLDPHALLTGHYALGVSDAELAAAYTLVGAERASPFRHGVPETSALALSQLGALERLVAGLSVEEPEPAGAE